MPLLPGKNQATVSHNISEFHKGPTFAKTEANHGKETANRQAVAVAMHERDKSGGAVDHKAAIAKMHPEHLHKMVQHAMSGKAGPEMQKMAQQATMQHSGAMNDQDGDEKMPMAKTSPFSDNDGDEGMAPQQPGGMSRSSMFGMGGE